MGKGVAAEHGAQTEEEDDSDDEDDVAELLVPAAELQHIETVQ